MQRLRAKLGQAAAHLETVRGVGYRYVEPAS
jgi:DNA-binding response OmpR family regulator